MPDTISLGRYTVSIVNPARTSITVVDIPTNRTLRTINIPPQLLPNNEILTLALYTEDANPQIRQKCIAIITDFIGQEHIQVNIDSGKWSRSTIPTE